MHLWIGLILIVSSWSAAAERSGTASERFAEAEALYRAHLDTQSDRDMLELMKNLAQHHPRLKVRYQSLLKSGLKSGQKLVPTQTATLSEDE